MTPFTPAVSEPGAQTFKSLASTNFATRARILALRAFFGGLCLSLIIQVAAQEPTVPFQLGGGWEGYRESCMSCHGKWGDGTDKGPPLMHQYYLPGHHGDSAFLRAITQGAKAHHWNFGDMPPVENVSIEKARHIIVFIRWLQKEQGLLH